MEYIYCILLLKKAGKEINEDNIKKVLDAAGVKADEAKIKALVASLSEINIDEAIKEAAVAPVAVEKLEVKSEKKEEEKEEKRQEEAAAGLGSLFG